MQGLEPNHQIITLGLTLQNEAIEALIRDNYQELAYEIFMQAVRGNCGVQLSGVSQALVAQAITLEAEQLGDILRESIDHIAVGRDFFNTVYYCSGSAPIACDHFERALEAGIAGNYKQFIFCVAELQQETAKNPMGEQLESSIQLILNVYDTCIAGFTERVLYRLEELLH